MSKKPIHKFNGGKGATLCHNCSVIITEGLTDDLYCDRCTQWLGLDYSNALWSEFDECDEYDECGHDTVEIYGEEKDPYGDLPDPTLTEYIMIFISFGIWAGLAWLAIHLIT